MEWDPHSKFSLSTYKYFILYIKSNDFAGCYWANNCWWLHSLILYINSNNPTNFLISGFILKRYGAMLHKICNMFISFILSGYFSSFRHPCLERILLNTREKVSSLINYSHYWIQTCKMKKALEENQHPAHVPFKHQSINTCPKKKNR